MDAVREYLESDMGYKEVAAKHDVAATTLKYWVQKYLRQQKQEQEVKEE
jgi:transposase-like protein